MSFCKVHGYVKPEMACPICSQSSPPKLEVIDMICQNDDDNGKGNDDKDDKPKKNKVFNYFSSLVVRFKTNK